MHVIWIVHACDTREPPNSGRGGVRHGGGQIGSGAKPDQNLISEFYPDEDYRIFEDVNNIDHKVASDTDNAKESEGATTFERKLRKIPAFLVKRLETLKTLAENPEIDGSNHEVGANENVHKDKTVEWD